VEDRGNDENHVTTNMSDDWECYKTTGRKDEWRHDLNKVRGNIAIRMPEASLQKLGIHTVPCDDPAVDDYEAKCHATQLETLKSLPLHSCIERSPLRTSTANPSQTSSITFTSRL
jgi:hypothetical protein